MKDKTIECAAEVVKTIKSECNDGVIKDYRILTLTDIKTCKDVGFAVVFQLSTKYDYHNTVFDSWKDKLDAECYVIRVKRNQLEVMFKVYFE